MLRSERSPAWHRDVKWTSAVVLVLAVAVATLTFSLSELTVRTRALPVLNEMLTLTLAPSGSSPELAVRTGAAYTPGERLTLVPGVAVYADPTEIPTFTVDQAVDRIAGVLAEKTVQGGSAAALGLVTDAGIQAQLQRAFQGPVLDLIRAGLDAQMLPSGLEDGSRLADWPKQAAENPGKPVQPVVGLFVYADPAQLRSLTPRQIGVLVVSKLAEEVLKNGQAATQDNVVNVNLRARFDAALQGPVPASLHELYAALFLARSDVIASRLAEARAAIQGDKPQGDSLSGLLPASELAGLTPAQADAKVLDALAQRSYAQGSSAILALLTRGDQRTKVAAVAPLLDAFSAGAHARYLLWTWLTGGLALILLIVLVASSVGLRKLSNVGLAVAFGAAGGTLLFGRLGSLSAAATPQAALAQFGVLGGLASGFRYVTRALPAELWQVPLRVYAITLGVGVALVLLALVLALLGRFRPRRRNLL